MLGVLFLTQELAEFSAMVALGVLYARRHGLHVTVGLAWLVVMLAQLATLGFQTMVGRRFLCFALFCTPASYGSACSRSSTLERPDVRGHRIAQGRSNFLGVRRIGRTRVPLCQRRKRNDSQGLACL